MRPLLALLLPAALLPAVLLAAGADAPSETGFERPGETRAALRRAQAEQRQAQARSLRLEREAENAGNAADRAAREAAALAARVQQAEAGIGAAEARLTLATGERAQLLEALGREQQPLVRLTAALQQFSRRPIALTLARPGSVKDVVYVRAVLDTALPHVREETTGLRALLARSRTLREEALAAVASLRLEEERLRDRRQELAAIEGRQRLASREALSTASREAERALALGEQARDLDALVSELDRAGALRDRLAALSGPLPRPSRPQDAQAVPSAAAPPALAAAPPPSPYLLPVTGRTTTGFGAREGGIVSNGLTLSPRPGAQVVAPAAGRVAFAGSYRGYGRIVIIEHDGEWISLVTGLARADVRVGQTIVAGAPLGVVGANDPQVTLELRRGGEPVNPLRFVG